MLKKFKKLFDIAERQIESENNYLAAGIAAFIGLMVIIGLMSLYYAKKKGKCKSCTKNEICTMIQEELVDVASSKIVPSAVEIVTDGPDLSTEGHSAQQAGPSGIQEAQQEQIATTQTIESHINKHSEDDSRNRIESNDDCSVDSLNNDSEVMKMKGKGKTHTTKKGKQKMRKKKSGT